MLGRIGGFWASEEKAVTRVEKQKFPCKLLNFNQNECSSTSFKNLSTRDLMDQFQNGFLRGNVFGIVL